MEVMEPIITMISTVGFPIVCAAALFWKSNHTEKELSDVQSQIDDLRQQLADPDLTQEEYDKLMDELDDLRKQKAYPYWQRSH